MSRSCIWTGRLHTFATPSRESRNVAFVSLFRAPLHLCDTLKKTQECRKEVSVLGINTPAPTRHLGENPGMSYPRQKTERLQSYRTPWRETRNVALWAQSRLPTHPIDTLDITQEFPTSVTAMDTSTPTRHLGENPGISHRGRSLNHLHTHAAPWR